MGKIHLHPKLKLSTWQHSLDSNLKVCGYFHESEKSTQQLHFLHGNGFCGLSLLPLAAEFSSQYDIRFTDAPGHGSSDQPVQRMPDWQAMAADISEAVSKSTVGKEKELIGVGHSMGGILTLMAAAQNPTLFSRIILLDPVLFTPEVILAQRVMRATGLWKRSKMVQNVAKRRAVWKSKQELEQYLARKTLYKNWHHDAIAGFIYGGSQSVENGEQQLLCNPEWESAIFGSYPRGLWRTVAKVSVPVDIIMAQQTYSFIPRGVKRAAKRNPLVRWQLSTGNHCFAMEKPEQTAGLIRDILRK